MEHSPEHSGVPFGDFKQSLGSAAAKYSDQEIAQMRDVFDKIADLAFDEWLSKKNASVSSIMEV